MTLTFGSLFAGVGGMDLGLERSGMRCVWQCEIDPFARRVLAKHWSDVRRHDDVRTFPPGNPDDWRCDLIAGGFPCQDISDAGRRAGIGGARSGLWAEFARVVRLVRPRFVLVENVAALLGRGMGRVLGDLAACGYDAEWDCLPAARFGAPHERDRLFLVAYPGGIPEHRRIFAFPADGFPRNQAWHPTQDLKSGRQWKRWLVEAAAAVDGTIAGSDFRGVDDGISEGLDRFRVIGNAVVPQVAEFIGRRIVEAYSCPPP
jgi:DNA (cytosine-5)-methyltransferase 1